LAELGSIKRRREAGPATGGDAMVSLSSGVAPDVPAAPVERPGPQDPRRWSITNVRLTPEQLAACSRLAVERKVARGFGRADVSEIVRDALDAYLAKGAP